MSGGGGGSSGGDSVSTACETLRFDAQLTSPQPAVVQSLKQGEVLTVTIAMMKGQLVVQVRKRSDQIAGGLTGPDATRLRQCIEQGHEYKATVLTINGGQVRVRVEHV